MLILFWRASTGQNLKTVYEELKRRKILVRYFDAPGLQDCLRITVGAPKEVQALLNEMAAIAGSREPASLTARERSLAMARIKIIDTGSYRAQRQRHRPFAQILHRGAGLEGERVDEFKAGKVGFPSVRINAATIIDLFPNKDALPAERRRKNQRQLEPFLFGGWRRRFCRYHRLSKRKSNCDSRRAGVALGRARASDLGLFSRSRRQRDRDPCVLKDEDGVWSDGVLVSEYDGLYPSLHYVQTPTARFAFLPCFVLLPALMRSTLILTMRLPSMSTIVSL